MNDRVLVVCLYIYIMIVNVIGCGESAKNWHESPADLNIGVNDCYKFGHRPDWLVIIDSPRRFTPQRIETIKCTRPDKYITRDDQWKQILQRYEKTSIREFTKHLKKGHVYHSKTSTFVAMSLAFNAGATEIVLWGVDLQNHHLFKPGNPIREHEIRQYRKFAGMLGEMGVKVNLGAPGSALEPFFHVKQSVQA